MTARIEHLSAVVDAIRRGDRDDFRRRAERIMHPDCEWEPLITAVEGRDYRGPDGVAAFFEDFVGTFEVSSLDHELRAAGDGTVLMLATMRVRGRESGIEVPRELAVIFEFEGDLVRHARAYESHREAEALVA